jgi:Asp-tRNA(Asn)/Glu-tRNA(Gln) amidotransferase A subunit family amidase
MSDLWQLGALEFADRIRTKETSSREVPKANLQRVEQSNGHLNAIVRLLTNAARAAGSLTPIDPVAA